MKNYLFFLMCGLLLFSCKDKDEYTPAEGLIGTWLYKGMGFVPDYHYTYEEVRVFGVNDYLSTYTYKAYTLPDSTVIHETSRVIHSNYIFSDPVLKSYNAQCNVNGVLEYSGGTYYEFAKSYYNKNMRVITKAECWRRLSGIDGQIDNSVFYLMDSLIKVPNDSSVYIHYKYSFDDDYLHKYTLTSQSSAMPDSAADWEVKGMQANITDKTFDSFYWNKVGYCFFEGNLITTMSLQHDEHYAIEFYRQ